MSLFNRTISKITEKRQRILDGKINCIPWGLPRFEQISPGIEQGKYMLFTANSKVGKTQITDWLLLYNTIKQVVDDKLNIRLKIFYFSLEMTKEEKMLSAFSNILFVKEGVRIQPSDLKSTKADKPLRQETIDLINKYKEYFDKIEEIVEFIDDIRNPTGMYNMLKKYALLNGTQHRKEVIFTNNATGEKYTQEIDDFYEPNDPDEYVIIIIDHLSLISAEKEGGKELSLKQSIDKLSSNYLVRLRNKYGYIPAPVQQQAASQESLENAKANKLKPTLDGLGESKITQRDANIIFGLFSPFRHDITTYMGYDIRFFGDNIRFLEIIGGREGGAGTVCPLYFDGAVNYFKELPLPTDETNMINVHKYVEKMRKT